MEYIVRIKVNSYTILKPKHTPKTIFPTEQQHGLVFAPHDCVPYPGV